VRVCEGRSSARGRRSRRRPACEAWSEIKTQAACKSYTLPVSQTSGGLITTTVALQPAQPGRSFLDPLPARFGGVFGAFLQPIFEIFGAPRAIPEGTHWRKDRIEAGCDGIGAVRKTDSPLERKGFEPSVPLGLE
jgi:hypothetical protein